MCTYGGGAGCDDDDDVARCTMMRIRCGVSYTKHKHVTNLFLFFFNINKSAVFNPYMYKVRYTVAENAAATVRYKNIGS